MSSPDFGLITLHTVRYILYERVGKVYQITERIKQREDETQTSTFFVGYAAYQQRYR